ncbi:MAG TPA: PVC-type heme-binding CxxCH protein, partial [Rhodothermales bacterium]|nr:PVC-type heme-binding CxxCH protein [Rhodothermales bacterium]
MFKRFALAAVAASGLFFSVPLEAVAQDASVDPQRLPEHAISAFDVAPGLEVTMFASEPMILNPTNMDVDARGRVWMAEGYNYRPKLNPGNPTNPEGDQIVILEDTDGDGRADTKKVFYQGNDVNAALGVFKMGDKLIVSSSPNVIVFTDENGDDVPDDKEVIFTGISGVQHDHAVHAFVFGPDGKLYFNMGNAGEQINDRNGNPVIDEEGHKVAATGHPYRDGMAFRMNPDGSEFEVLGNNFRNNYELAVDSYGTIWQSDNDDDGNKGVRINYVMEHGNFGYKDEITGASWRVPRVNLEDEIPLQHWHLNDPGVVPNLLQTGAGSPTGMVIYEGRLLPKPFWDGMIHSDAGPNVVRAYPVEKDGAGYTASIVNVVKSARDQWFRPSDVTVAPDGSLFIADWYDPGVGGHQVGDLDRGRIYRVAPPNTPYEIAPLDISTPAKAAEALKSPNMSRRYLAWTKLHEWGREAEPVLKNMWQKDLNPRFRARALWLLTKIPGRGDRYVRQALKDRNPDLRITGLRAARQLDVDVIPYAKMLVKDPSPQVRREVAIALRHNTSPEAAQLWAELAVQHDGKDRWYLEALGIGADGQWDRYFAAWKQQVGDGWNTPAGRDIVWRARTAKAIPLLSEIITDPNTSPQERPRYFRAFDFQTGPSKQDALIAMLDGHNPDQPQITALSLSVMDSSNAKKSAQVRAALERTLALATGTQQFVDLVGRFGLT